MKSEASSPKRLNFEYHFRVVFLGRRGSFLWVLVQKRNVRAQLRTFEKTSVVRTILGAHKANLKYLERAK